MAESYDLKEIAARIGITTEYVDLLRRWLDRLVTSGQLAGNGKVYSSSRALAAPALKAMWDEAEALFSDNKGLFNYIHHCGRLMGDVVTGRESPLETLFPGGDFDLAQDLYERSQTMRYINGVAAAAASAFGAAASLPLRVLEIGAGTGGDHSGGRRGPAGVCRLSLHRRLGPLPRPRTRAVRHLSEYALRPVGPRFVAR